MPNRYFAIEFYDLSFEKKEELTANVVEQLREDYKEEAEETIRKDKNGEYKGMAWQEVYCRAYAIDWQMWREPEDADTFDWDYAITEETEKRAEKGLDQAMHHLEIEVEL